MILDFLLDPANWAVGGGSEGFPLRIGQHLLYTALALLVGFVVAFPIGLLIGHTGRGSFVAINAGNAGRALPTLGVLVLVVALAGTGLVPVTVGLVLLAIPPILTSTYAGVSGVDRETVDAARGMGMTERQIALRVELPNALPVILGGVRNATLQVISTATIAAYIGLGGLGRYLFDGLALRDYPRVVAGCIVIAVLAVVADLVLAVMQRYLISPGLRRDAARGAGSPAGSGGGPQGGSADRGVSALAGAGGADTAT